MKRYHLMAVLMLMFTLLISSCSTHEVRQQTKAGSTESKIVLHNLLPKNIKLVDFQTHRVAAGTRITSNLKFSTRKTRRSRPRGALLISVIKPDGTSITNQRITLNQRGRMANYSRYDFLINHTAFLESDLYLKYSDY